MENALCVESLTKRICGLWKFTEGKITVEGMDVRPDGRAAAGRLT